LALFEAPFAFVGTGPALAALVGAVAGGALGTFVGSAYGDTHFQRLASRLQKAQVLMSVNVAGRERTNEIEENLRRHGAETVRRIAF
jgi:outer membrane lipoprotein SlyB